jgi:drug/metabolite transporter (DMT)-like permease
MAYLIDLNMNQRTLAYIALGIICIVWGTTYTVIKYAIRDFPPFMLVGMRQTTAGIIMLSIAIAMGYGRQIKALPRSYLLRQVVTGVATITGGNGFITWGMQYVSSGLSSVIGALTPVVVLLISLVWHRRGERISGLTINGVLLGFAGLGVIFNDGWADFLNPDYRWGIAGCFASCFSWSLGTVMSKRYNDPAISPFVNGGIQITAGGIGGGVLSILLDKSHQIHHTFEGWAAAAYLAVIGSALAFTLYMFILRHLSATAASIYTYINPMVAISLGWLVFDEKVTSAMLFGIGITLLGVWLVNRGESTR